MKIKTQTIGLLAAVIVQSGCASNQPPIPVDQNPSVALKFARAMDLMVITDEGDNYLIYNKLSDSKHIYPLENPVRAGQVGQIKSAGNGMADVIAGVVTNTTAIPLIGVLTARGPAAIMDGVPRVGSWTSNDQYKDGKEIVNIVKASLPLMDGYKDSEICNEASTDVWYMNKHRGTDGKPVDLNPERLPKPPIKSAAMLKPFGLPLCFFYVASKPSNQKHFIEMSAKLGEQRALFIPGYEGHPPYIYHNGKTLEFKKG
ncbi:hypothetical protein LJQ72_10585 [Pectobacterium brasiliense]|uniref:hypothetical protein n=1 Tax=Pectobacterium brasiliense TaxID=180957 RepID=UPI001D0D6508|nr:hypothetical protein [Pectobacterium brasiliense]UDQ77958.1 hypothetical protein LJQ72_10585 [Pectobacterium brasiliense]